MSVYFSAIIEGGGGATVVHSTDMDRFQHHAHLQRGDDSGEIYSTEVTQTLDTSAEGDAMNFSGEKQNVT